MEGSNEARLARLWNDIQDEYRGQGVSNKLTFLTLNMFMDPGSVHGRFPNLSCSCAEARSLVPVLHAVCLRYETANPRDVHRTLALKHFSRIYAIVLNYGMHLPSEAASAYARATESFLAHYKWLAVDAVEKGQMCWQLVTKHHMMFHIAQLTELSLLNPRVSWCYQYENMVQQISRVAKASVNGIQLHQIGNNLLKTIPVCVAFATDQEASVMGKQRWHSQFMWCTHLLSHSLMCFISLRFRTFAYMFLSRLDFLI